MSGDVHLGFTGHEEDSENRPEQHARPYLQSQGRPLPDPRSLPAESDVVNWPRTVLVPLKQSADIHGPDGILNRSTTVGNCTRKATSSFQEWGRFFEYDDEQVHSDLVMVFGDHQVVADRRTRISFDDEQVVADTRTGGIGFSPYDSSTWTPGRMGSRCAALAGFCGMQRRWPGGGVQRDNDTWVDVPLKGASSRPSRWESTRSVRIQA